ncbi:MAG: hypothetical protein E5X59_27485, partial [Mesorhizobium sp.]
AIVRRPGGTWHRVGETPLHQPVVLALPRGGVPVAAEVAKALKAPLDLIIAAMDGAVQSRKAGQHRNQKRASGMVRETTT